MDVDKILLQMRKDKEDLDMKLDQLKQLDVVILEKVVAIEKKQEELGRDHIQLVERVDRVEDQLKQSTIATDVRVEGVLEQLREEIQEEKRKILRLCNIVLMGVPETEEGLREAESLMKVLLPSWMGTVTDNRIGVPNSKAVRPLRIGLSNVVEKKKALSSSGKLKDHQCFKHISVRRDLTKKEQAEWKEKAKVYAETRTRGAKRRREEGMENVSQRPRSSGIAAVQGGVLVEVEQNRVTSETQNVTKGVLQMMDFN